MLLQKTSKLLLTTNYDHTIEHIRQESKELSVHEEHKCTLYIYPEHNIRVDDVKKIIKHAYLSVVYTQYILLCVEQISTEAQNALLKMLEEPPKRNYFLLLCSNKNIFLPTVLSRLPLNLLSPPSPDSRQEIALPQAFTPITKMGWGDIFSFITTSKMINKAEAKLLIEQLLQCIQQQRITLNEELLELFSQSMQLLELGSKPIHVLSLILLKLKWVVDENK